MSLDLYGREVSERLDSLPKTALPEVGAFDGFLRGVGGSAMEHFAKAAREVSFAASALITPSLERAGGTELSDRYFKAHDEIFGSAVDYWTPNKAEVGVAGQIVGQLLATLPMVIASPAAAIGVTGLAAAEDLARKGIEPSKAVAVGAAQAAGMGLGVWMPILGANGWQRVLVGGAGFNLAQGVVTRAASGAILEGTEAAEDFKAFDGTAMTLDVLLGMAFGSLVHLSPKARAKGAEVWGRVADWAKNAKPSEVDAILALRQAQHLNVDSMPGKASDLVSIDAHNTRMRTAVEQLARDERVDVSDLPPTKADEGRIAEMAARADELVKQADRVRKSEGLPDLQETEAPPARVSAEPPPPRGEGERPGGSDDPLRAEADSFVAARPDLEMRIGTDAHGEPIYVGLRQYLDDARETVALAHDDMKLYEVAAACLAGR